MAAWISIFISYPQFLTVPFHCVKFPKQAQKEQKERARFETVKFKIFAKSETGTTGTTGTKTQEKTPRKIRSCRDQNNHAEPLINSRQSTLYTFANI